MFTHPVGFRDVELGLGFLNGVISNMELELDMSTDQNQRILNRIASPDSGASQAANDFFLGSDGTIQVTDPTFNTDRYDFDGGDLFGSVANTPFMDTIGHIAVPLTFIFL